MNKRCPHCGEYLDQYDPEDIFEHIISCEEDGKGNDVEGGDYGSDV